MTGDPLRMLQAGDRIDSIPAAAWNAFVAAARYVRGQLATGGQPGPGQLTGPGQVLVCNASDDDREQFDVLELTTPLVAPAENAIEFGSRVALRGVAPTRDRAGKFAVLAEPIPKGQFGRAWIDGVCPARVVGASTGAYADTQENECGALQASDYGGARILWSEPGTEDERLAYVRLNDPCTFLLGKTVAGPDDAPYPEEESNPQVYRVQLLIGPTFPREAGDVGVSATEVERFDFACNLIGTDYIPEGSTIGLIPLEGQLYTMDKTTAETTPCPCGDFAVIVLGGSGAENLNDAYDPAGDAWKRKTAIPSPERIIHLALRDASGSNLYIFGSGQVLTSVDADAYNAVSDAWTAKTDIPEATLDARGGVVAGAGYLVNGTVTNPKFPAKNIRYTFASDAYAYRTPPDDSTLGMGGSWELDGLIYVAGQRVGTTNVPGVSKGTFASYNAASDTWTIAGAQPYLVDPDDSYQREPAVHVEPGYAYLIGGNTGSAPVSSVQRWDAGANTWSGVASMPSPARSGARCASVGIAGYVIGGIDAGGNSPLNHQFTPNGTSTWSTKTPLPTPARSLHSATAMG